jgi:hypothetical protein
MRKGALIVYLGIMLAALLGYMLLDLNVRRADTEAGDSLKMSAITMLQSECAVNMQLLEKDAAKDYASLRISGLKNFMACADKRLKFGEQAGKIWQALKERIVKEGLVPGQDDEIRVKNENFANIANIDKDLKDFMNRAAENGFDFNF